MTKFGLGIRDWNDLDDIRDSLGSHQILINNLNFTIDGYEELAIQTANREKAESQLATLGGLSTVSEQNIAAFSGAAWNITAVALNQSNPAYIWNIVNGETYPFLSWHPVV